MAVSMHAWKGFWVRLLLHKIWKLSVEFIIFFIFCKFCVRIPHIPSKKCAHMLKCDYSMFVQCKCVISRANFRPATVLSS